jgi:hypothetical protein
MADRDPSVFFGYLGGGGMPEESSLRAKFVSQSRKTQESLHVGTNHSMKDLLCLPIPINLTE